MSAQLFFNTFSNLPVTTPARLDYTMTLPPHLQLSSAPTLQDKMCQIPATNLDKLHPNKNDPEPYVEYVDEGLWKSRIVFQKDSSDPVMRSHLQAVKHQNDGKTHESLDALCEAELKRRMPNYQLITGFEASLKTRFPTLARLVMGSEQFCQKLTRQDVNKYKTQIAYSTVNRDDLICQPHIENQHLNEQLHLTDDSILRTEHLFAKNSPLNGQSFIRNGKVVHLSQAIACSSDRHVENTGNLRLIQTKDKESICYTGRADSDRKALEQASFIFLNELKTRGKGITQSTDEQGNPIYQIDYVVNSMLSLPWILRRESTIAPFPEAKYLEVERKAFLALKEKGAVTIEDPQNPGKKYQVKFNPILFSRSTNLFTRLENWLPPFFTGRCRAEQISEEGFSDLNVLVSQKLLSLQQLATQSPLEKKLQLEQKIKRIHYCLQTLEKNMQSRTLLAEEEWLIRDYLCKLLDLTIVYHCKSSTDRTSIAIALSSSLKQWIEQDLPIPENLIDLLQDERFKELFAANWMTGHQVTRYARGGKGTVAGQQLNSKNLGLSLSRGIPQNPSIAHLLPKRYLKDFPTAQTLKYSAAYMALLVPISIFFYLPLIFITACRHLAYLGTGCKNHHLIGPSPFTLPRLPWTLLFNFHTIFPKKILNEDSPQVGPRCLLSGGKYGGRKDKD